ncbi:hypothetical protein A3D42_01605 [Candidatus Nomurabacteria bacterium RIFCSPHIGHO2_02_FULL_41_18]|uniref:DUF192 domain-containing protein n=1 Tax=Candidatus Nomurabacteria bacterium RIFCSPHIGHO2_02_FULL_41_18 TaxID=1801754 RepID=A0A1F6W5M9_9BACT|nr:MAG: hypothetical protein A2737_01420 [Candidatus Nomurabacteria bacterium RIFCSPHIGHO2_01_FULL_41_71]OGI77213.1 MAG: hypothetical protein A3D42_01605 [Candidatus Nomurabacteria bacterium RIFCSPHIGHO2_02_FULL_41_18]OGI89388.1 MAG: hypothetical protein A3B01_01340 [Candidatus Nomurabacteria bacterium RIFCSPLOWO2_01_FULL_41_52b]OGJ00124.1 MAG: hypothetical protein A3I90_00245 [Candidatus Nomurabacteria bacterium RIFCSPLOWO2_02_FULL_41_9]
MEKWLNFQLIFGLTVVVLSSVGLFLNKNGEVKIIPETYVGVAGQNIKVELARTPEVQARGLSGRESLKENEGMLFVFDNLGRHGFWMKDMNFPIDIIWISEDKKVVYIKKDAKPHSYPEIFAPDEDALYALEVVFGFSDKYGLKEGDSVEFAY